VPAGTTKALVVVTTSLPHSGVTQEKLETTIPVR
jgi:hypothetical protein